MAFFRDEPRPPSPAPVEQPVWMRPPPGELGGWLGLSIELARSDEHIVLLGPLRAHPTGVEITIETRSRLEHLQARAYGPFRHDAGALRYGVRFADGRSSTSSRPHLPPDADVEGPVLMFCGGGGGGGTHREQLWLWPLPSAGDVEFFMKWGDAGFDERSVMLDGDTIRDAASRAEKLWEPLSEVEQREVQEKMMEAMGRFASSHQVIGFTTTDSPKGSDSD